MGGACPVQLAPPQAGGEDEKLAFALPVNGRPNFNNCRHAFTLM